MHRLLVFGAAILIGLALPMACRADGLPSCPCPPHAKAKVKTVHRARHRVVRVRAPAIVALPGPYDLRAAPPPPLDSAYEPAMVQYFRDPSITGYRPGSAAGYVEDDGTDVHVEGIYYHRTNWPPAHPLPPVPPIDNYPFRTYSGQTVLEYDGAIGEYVQLSHRDAALALQVANVKPLPFVPFPPP